MNNCWLIDTDGNTCKFPKPCWGDTAHATTFLGNSDVVTMTHL